MSEFQLAVEGGRDDVALIIRTPLLPGGIDERRLELCASGALELAADLLAATDL